jgi:plastocyanin
MNQPIRWPTARCFSIVNNATLIVLTAVLFTGSAISAGMESRFFLPGPAASRIVSVKATGTAADRIVIMTEAVAVRETAPPATIKRFGEVYSFSPATVFVRQDQPTLIALWNLQPDDEHDFSVIGQDDKPLMDLRLAPLSITSYVFTFHKRGVYAFRCLIHQPEMSGQFVVEPPGDTE